MISRFTIGILIALFSSLAFSASGSAPQPEETILVPDDSAQLSEDEKYTAWARKIWGSIDKQTGEIKISAAHAVLNVPEGFIYLGPADTTQVLVDVWGNPPGQTTLGMLMPSNMTPFDGDSWAVTIDYEEDGYVSDENASDIDYTDMLNQMKADTSASSDARVEQGYEPIELVGWASPPYYDTSQKKLHWAKEIKFGSEDAHTLNYNIRVLGRKGVLVLNFIAAMDQKAVIDSNIDTVLAIADFDQGSKYSDFDPDIDKIAAYGIGALVAGKVIAKTGLIAMAFIFLKKFGVIILIGAGALFKKLLSKKNK